MNRTEHYFVFKSMLWPYADGIGGRYNFHIKTSMTRIQPYHTKCTVVTIIFIIRKCLYELCNFRERERQRVCLFSYHTDLNEFCFWNIMRERERQRDRERESLFSYLF